MKNIQKVILFTVVAAALFVSIAGCAPSPATPIEPPSSITIVIPEDPPNFNPILNDTGYDGLVMEMTSMGLTDIDADGKVFPELAAELPTTENDGVQVGDSGAMEVTWKLRQDVKWADGTPFSADDVIFTYQAITNPDTGSWFQGVDYLSDVEKVDQYTVKFFYSSVYTGYLTQFGGEQMAIWPAHFCKPEQGFVNWDCNRNPLSLGPYTLKEWVEGDHMIFERNPNYYQAGKPEIDTIIVKIVPDDTVRKQMMLNGDADIDMWVKEVVIEDLKKSDKVKVSITEAPRWVMRIFMNQSQRGETSFGMPHPLFSNVLVRRAIRQAIDVDTLTKGIFLGYAQPVWTEFFREPYVCNIPRPTYDPESAKALLEEAGWQDTNGDGIRECHNCGTAEDGYVMEIEFGTYAEFGESMTLAQQLVSEQLKVIGIKTNITQTEGSVLWADSQSGGIEQSGNYDMDMWDDGYAGVDPTDFLWEYYSVEAATPDYGYNFVRWNSPAFNDLLGLSYTLDETVRKDLFCQMAKILDEQVPQILLFTIVNADAYSARLDGVHSNANDLVTWNVADWKIVK